MGKETMYETFKRSRFAALERTFTERADSFGKIFVWQSLLGDHKKYRYGSYKSISRQDLENRTHEIEFWDGAVSIFWTDRLHNSGGI